MKKLIASVFLLNLIQISCTSDENQGINQQASDIEKVRGLANKYGVELTLNKEASKNQKGVPLDLAEIEKQFKSIAEQKKYFAEEARQIEALNSEIRSKKNAIIPDDYLKTLEKYPLVKQQVIKQWGGPAGFEKYKIRLLEKQDSVARLPKRNLQKAN